MQIGVGYILLAVLMSWLSTMALIWLNNIWGLCDFAAFSWAYDLIHECGYGVRWIVFWVLLVIFLITRAHLIIFRFMGALVVIAIAIIIAILIGLLVMWISSSLL